MFNNNYICALDIGSSKIAACVARIKRGRINNIFFDSLPAKGIKEGIIVDSIDLVSSVTKLLKNLKNKSGINIKFVYTNISGKNIITKHSHATVPLAERGNKIITVLDLEKVNEQARILGSNLEEEIIHRIPFGYTIDTNSNILNPLGLYSHKLGVDLYLICAKLSSVQSLNRVINQSGYEIKGLFFSGLATSKAVFTPLETIGRRKENKVSLTGFNKELKEGFNLICDIGCDITELLVFKDGLLCDIEILPFGGNDLTLQIQNALQVPFDLAEDIKRSYGIIGDPMEIEEDREILVKKDNIYKNIKQRFVAEVINSKAKSICSIIKDTIEKKVQRYKVNNFIVAGRSILLEGFIETLESLLQVPVKLGRIMNPEILSLTKEDSTVSGHKYLTYLTALGMICEVQEESTQGTLPTHKPAKNFILKTINRFKEVYQEYF